MPLNTNDDKKSILLASSPSFLKRVDKTGNPQYKMIFFFSGYFCDMLIRMMYQTGKKCYVTKIICFFRKEAFVN